MAMMSIPDIFRHLVISFKFSSSSIWHSAVIIILPLLLTYSFFKFMSSPASYLTVITVLLLLLIDRIIISASLISGCCCHRNSFPFLTSNKSGGGGGSINYTHTPENFTYPPIPFNLDIVSRSLLIDDTATFFRSIFVVASRAYPMKMVVMMVVVVGSHPSLCLQSFWMTFYGCIPTWYPIRWCLLVVIYYLVSINSRQRATGVLKRLW